MAPRKGPPRNRGPTYEPSKTEEIVMLALSNKELYGLQIPQAMQQASEGQRTLGIGSLYPTLHKLEKKGLVKSYWGDDRPTERGGARRRYYKLTREGIATLEAIQSFRDNLLAWKPG